VVAHHTPDALSALPASNAPNSASSSTNKRGGNAADGSDPSVPVDSLPRFFTQNFILVNRADKEGGVNCSSGTDDSHPIVGRFFVQADTLRFVG
jgi:hypothetical protein